MNYKRLGKAGIRISELGYGSWITFAKQLDRSLVKQLIKLAFDQGINFFDTAEVYAEGEAEVLLGEAIKDLRREDLVISTKIFWGGSGPNDKGLSRKHLFEGTKNSLKRLSLEYVDLLFCHRPDPNTPMEEIVLAMNDLIRQGYAFYWGTSEWSADQIKLAFLLADQLNAYPPTMEQPQYNLFHRQRVEEEYANLFEVHRLGATIWSPLASGILTGKYNEGIPENSRLAKEPWLLPENFDSLITRVKRLEKISKEMHCTLSQLAIAWCLKNKCVSSVILGATSVAQLLENLGALKVKENLSDYIMHQIDEKVLTL